ncbi:F0F1 ATP synthase subunit alpha [Orrella sp. 11846]|uniref:F0F1 ATP synthase subunit alpha n=1 Tax=Orrella sp. 11846 TaxID=3409913 RepID=UPI003B59E334
MKKTHLMIDDKQIAFDEWRDALLKTPAPEPVLTEAGIVTEVADGVAIVTGLARALADELLVFAGGTQGIVLDLEPGRLGVILLGPSQSIQVGEHVYRTQQVVSTPVGEGLLGRVVDALGKPLDGLGPIVRVMRQPVEVNAPSVLERKPVSRPLATGIKAVDAAIPIGLGQRQLIIGDRQTGKTSLAVDTILNQKHSDIISIYCAIGQRGDAVARVIQALTDADVLSKCIVINTGDEEAPGLAHIAPYCAMTMAEYFAAQGKDVLLVIDDLTHHARAYRELSLLLRRPPGREAFPGDIFYVHARLLERSGQWSDALGAGSITTLPIVETEAENLSAYIPTNLISITDGQVYLSPALVHKNQFPAVDLGLSVSRVGGKAQNRSLRTLSGNLRVMLAQFEELEDFARFGTRLDDNVRARLKRGNAVRQALRQGERDPMSTLEQLIVLQSALEGLFDDLSESEIIEAMNTIRAAARRELKTLGKEVRDNAQLSSEAQVLLLDVARQALEGVTPPEDLN